MCQLATIDKKRLLYSVLLATRIALLLEGAYLGLFYATDRLRATGSFNNPNQMGYWALLVIACLGLAKMQKKLTLLDVAALCPGYYIIALSLSKAASLSGGALVGLVFLACGMTRNSLAAVLCRCVSFAWAGDPYGRCVFKDRGY